MTAEAHERALRHLLGLQHADGCWEGEMVWNTMILSQYVIVRHIVGAPIPADERDEMILHYRVTRTIEGGWAMHPESGPYVYFTALAYVALRLLGVPPDDPLLVPARRWLRLQPGGVLAIPTWGRFWLALLGLYTYEAVNPFPPELFLLPRWLSVHPDRLYCHTRNIYQAIAYLYGRRFRVDLGDLGVLLRAELYGDQGKTSTDATAHRHTLSPTDVHVPPSAPLRALYRLARAWERTVPPRIRRRALDRCLRRVRDEQRASGHQGLSPVNGLLNCLALFSHNPADPHLADGLAGVEYWRWRDARNGIRYCGARSHSWDTAFALEALTAGPGTNHPQVAAAVGSALGFLLDAQVTEPLPAPVPQGRSPVIGGWCFSEGRHRWPVSDCTAEAAAALVQSAAYGLPIPPQRLELAAEFILARQNADGSFGTYEARRAPLALEALNPSEMYSNCMVEGSYIECTGSALCALTRLTPFGDDLLRRRIRDAVLRGTRFLRRSQLPDGAFPAAWGVHHIYGTFMAVRGLRAAGFGPAAPELRRAAAWLSAAQQPDGGWGEHYSGCLERRYVALSHSEPVMTAWAVLALLDCGAPDKEALQTGVRWLHQHQEQDGSWRQKAVTGVFFGTAMLHYRLYASYFPTWALGRYLQSLDISGP
ncbi:prenyltransferase/squalene oxidase repeat-containing protein [Nonomuraea sp. NPDC005650]|uniref:prenyltransferase/squalene oxidase repeat-containing protein n=1 Tax=Nonomuraea sp. NPDC005650 TaxID=3157045 RepID=UPI0033ADC1E3